MSPLRVSHPVFRPCAVLPLAVRHDGPVWDSRADGSRHEHLHGHRANQAASPPPASPREPGIRRAGPVLPIPSAATRRHGRQDRPAAGRDRLMRRPPRARPAPF